MNLVSKALNIFASDKYTLEIFLFDKFSQSLVLNVMYFHKFRATYPIPKVEGEKP